MHFNFDEYYEHQSGPVVQERRRSCLYVRRSTWLLITRPCRCI